MKKNFTNGTSKTLVAKRFYALTIALLMFFSSIPTLAGETVSVQILEAPPIETMALNTSVDFVVTTAALNSTVDLTSLDAPPSIIRLHSVGSLEDARAVLPQYVAVTTNPPIGIYQLQISWFIPHQSPRVFDPTPGAVNILDWMVIPPPDIDLRFPIWNMERGQATVEIHSSSLTIAHATAQDAINTLAVTNDTTEADFVATIENAITDMEVTLSSYGGFSLVPETGSRNGRLSLSVEFTGDAGAQTFVITRAIPRTRTATEAFLEWNYGTFATPRENNLWPATDGASRITLSDTNLSFYYATGQQAILGRIGDDRLAINVPNRSPTGSEPGPYIYDWYIPLDNLTGHNHNARAGWVITFPTRGLENINLSARQSSSTNGPGGFGLAYRIGTHGEWIRYDSLVCSWPLVSTRTDYPRDRVLGSTFQNVRLPDEIANQQLVQIKLYVHPTVVRHGGTHLTPWEGNTSINNIVLRGEWLLFYCDYCQDSGDCCENCNPCDCYVLTEIDAPPMDFGRLYGVTTFTQAVAQLPAYAAITTNPPTDHAPLPITWREVAWLPFNPASGFANIFEWSVLLPDDVENKTMLPVSGLTMATTYASEFDAARIAAQRATSALPVSNYTTADNFITSVENAIADYPGIVVSLAAFNLLPATATATGEITGTIRLERGAEHADIIINRTISFLINPLDNAEDSARRVIQNLSVTNNTTAEVFETAIISAINDMRIEISWQAFNKTPATVYALGEITGIIRLYYGGEYRDIEVNRVLMPLFPLDSLLRTVIQQLNAVPISSDTTAQDFISVAEFVRRFDETIEVTTDNDFNLILPTETRTGRITMTLRFTRGDEYYVHFVSRYMPRTRIASEMFLEWDYGRFAQTRPGNLWPATDGSDDINLSATNLAFFYSDGVQATLGRTQNDRLAINVPNRVNGWFTIDPIGMPIPGSFTANTSAGWVITFSTLGWESINFSASQASSNNGPGGFGLAYRIGTQGRWNSFAYDAPWPRVQQLVEATTLGATFQNAQLPDELNNQPIVQLKLYITGEVRVGGSRLVHDSGNTSINNIAFKGERITDVHCDYCKDSGDCCDYCNQCDFPADWIVKTDPTCKTEGVEYRVCTRCGVEETRPIPKLDCYCDLSDITITFDLSGGSFAVTTPPALTVTSGSAIGTLPQMPTGAVPNGISKEGYRFTGWFAYVNGDFIRIRSDFIITRSITLIATWQVIPDPANFRVGSTNDNRRITSADATRIARWLVGSYVADFCILAADIDGDGEVTIVDVTLLARWLVGHNVYQFVAH